MGCAARHFIWWGYWQWCSSIKPELHCWDIFGIWDELKLYWVPIEKNYCNNNNKDFDCIEIKKYTLWTPRPKMRPQLRPYWDCFCYTIETQMCQCSGDFEQKLWGLQHCCKRGPHNGWKKIVKENYHFYASSLSHDMNSWNIYTFIDEISCEKCNMYCRGIKIWNAPSEMISKPMSSSLTMLDSIIEAS